MHTTHGHEDPPAEGTLGERLDDLPTGAGYQPALIPPGSSLASRPARSCTVIGSGRCQ